MMSSTLSPNVREDACGRVKLFFIINYYLIGLNYNIIIIKCRLLSKYSILQAPMRSHDCNDSHYNFV